MKVERDRIELEGRVVDSANGKFKVQITDTHFVMCTISGRIRQNGVRILLADTVRVEISEYDTEQGRIVYRIK